MCQLRGTLGNNCAVQHYNHGTRAGFMTVLEATGFTISIRVRHDHGTVLSRAIAHARMRKRDPDGFDF